jgi:3-deoxy-7-phosphoheptulonate synthase
MTQVTDINVVSTTALPSPHSFVNEIARSEEEAAFVAESRKNIDKIIFGGDKRLLVVVGPCSIHDVEAGKVYAQRLLELSEKVSDRLYLVMRVYFEKPRTTVGWKGLIMDPKIDGTCDIPAGLKIARQFLQDVIKLGMPTATELLDPITPQYIADYICWSAIGARTAESQTHRQMASGLSMPLGIKNGTGGSLKVAVNAINAAMHSQTFLGIDQQGQAAEVTTRGNPNCHIILRGSEKGSNYHRQDIEDTEKILRDGKLIPAIMVDASHDNSGKDHTKQPEVIQTIVEQINSGCESIIGVMLESNLIAGNQKIPDKREDIVYGQSITDACIDWETTEALILETYSALESRFSPVAS